MNLHTLDVNDLDIQRIMRHSDVAVTRASYIKVPDSMKKAAMAKLEKALKVRKSRKKAELALGTGVGTEFHNKVPGSA